MNYFINRFGQEMDENCHLVIASRSLLSLPDLPIMVGRSQVMGLGFEELVFSPPEIQALLQRNYNQSISSEEANKLVRETEGWITGLLLSAETMWKGMADKVRVARVSGVNVYDYLAQQVLDQQPQQVRGFLLQTSLLEEFNAQLCQTVFGQAPEGTIWTQLIDTVLHHNLFVQPVENGGTWLRYHHLFRDFLQEQFSKEQPVEERRILRRLVEVYSERKEWEKAYDICQRIDNDDEIVIDLIEQAITPMGRAGQIKTLGAWCDSLPSDALTSRPFLAASFGSIVLNFGEAEKALSLLKPAEKALRNGNDYVLLARTLTWEAYAYLNLGEYQTALEFVEEALDLAEHNESPHIAHAEASKVKGLILNWIGQASESVSWLTQSLDLYRTLDDEVNAASVQLSLGLVYMNTGRQSQALLHYQHALSFWRQSNNIAKQATLLNNMGVSHHLGGDLLQAKICFDEALESARQSGLLRAEAFILTSMGDLYIDLCFLDAAWEQYQQARQIAQQLDARFLLLYLCLAEVKILRSRGDFADAQQALSRIEKLAHESHSSYESSLWALEKGCLLVALEDAEEAIPYLNKATQKFSNGGYPREVALSSLYSALASRLLGEKEIVLKNLRQAARAASELESLYPIAAAGQKAIEVIEDFKDEAEIGEFIQCLLKQVDDIDRDKPRLRRLIREQDGHSSLSPPVLNIQAFGEMRVELNGESITIPEWANQRMVRELFFLLLENPKGMTKEAISDTLWPGGELHLLQRRFNNVIYRLRRSLGKETVFLDQSSGRYQFKWGMDYCYDVESFRTKLEQAREEQDPELKISLCKEAIDLYRGSYFPKAEGIWAVPIREDLKRIYLEATLQVAEFHFHKKDYGETLIYSARIFSEEPCHESTHCLVMRVHAARGDRPGVATQFHRCEEALQLQLGVRPLPETEFLFSQLMGE